MRESAAVTPDPADALGSALRVLLGVTGAESVTLWLDREDGAELVAAAGDLGAGAYDLRLAAGALLADRAPEGEGLSAAEIELPAHGRALALAQDSRGPAGAHDSLLRAARPSLASLLVRRAGAAATQAASELAALQRQLQRLRFDLHDGPQQDVHLLAQDLHLFREQLAPILADHPDRERAIGRLDDLQAQLVALDHDLRRLSSAVRSPLLSGSLAQALVQVAETFSARTAIVPRTELSGDIESLTDSQQIALISLIREALSNVRRHSDAEHVEIAIVADAEAITVEVRDDGSGFDPGVDAARAVRDGHLGIVGMRERMRMLGGQTEIRSAPGGPTVVAASLPRWPVEPDPAAK